MQSEPKQIEYIRVEETCGLGYLACNILWLIFFGWMSFIICALASNAEKVQAVYSGQEYATPWHLLLWLVVCVAVSLMAVYKEE